MEQQITLLAFLIIGLIFGIFATWLILRSRSTVSVANAVGETKLVNVRLNEKVAALQEENTRYQAINNEQENQINTLRNQLNDVKNENAQLAERATRIDALEKQLEEINYEFKEKTDSLQTKLQHEFSRNATLAEQVVYLPESLEKIKQLESEQKRLEQTSAEQREKIGSFETTTNYLSDTIKQLEEEKTNFVKNQSELMTKKQELLTKIAELSTQLEAENTQLLERNERIKTLEQQSKELNVQLKELQSKLQEETNRNATLAEQVVYLPESLEKIKQLEIEQTQLNQTLANQREKIGAFETTVNHQIEQIKQFEQETNNLKTSKTELTQHKQELMAKIAELTTQLEAERTQGAEKIALLNDAKEQLANQFKSLASDILEDKSRRFTEQNQTNIEQLLNPLKTKLQEFQGKVEEVYIQEGKERSSLAEQVKQLMSLNHQLSQDAHNLTSALKGQAKTQGNWGEFILERILENSGLIKDEHYKTQSSHTREDGTRAQPDVVMYLPEGKHLIIDSKVSVVAYNEYVNAEKETTKNNALKRHIDSIRTHIKELSSKNYQDIYQLKSPDFVIMFIPVEPAFMLAISEDNEMWQEAWAKNVLLVSPSTLLFVLRTITHLWRQEQQTRNAQDIAKRGGELYDKLVGFVEDFEKIGERLKQAQKSYDDAFGKFTTGRGNAVRQAEMLRDMGVKSGKSLPNNLLELAIESG